MRDNAAPNILDGGPSQDRGRKAGISSDISAEIIPFVKSIAEAGRKTNSVAMAGAQSQTGAQSKSGAQSRDIDITSHEGLGLIVKRLSDLLFLPHDELPPQLHALVDQALAQLVDLLDVKSRFQLAERVSRSPEVPQLLVKRLIFDGQAVAQPILESDQKLNDLDLSRLVMKGGLAHRLMVANRKDLSATITNLLVGRQEEPVVLALLDNNAVRLDGSTIDLIIEKFSSNEEILVKLAARADLNPRQGFKLFWSVNSERRMKLLGRFAVSRHQVRDVASDLLILIKTDLSLQSDVSVRSLRLAFGPAMQLASESSQSIPEIDTSRFDQMLIIIKQRAHISRKTFAKIISDQGGEPLAVLCKAVSIKKADFICLARIMYKVNNTTTLLNEYLDKVAEVYDRLSWDGADMVLRYWDNMYSAENR